MSNNGKNSLPSLVSNRSLMDNSSRPMHSISLLDRNCNEKTECHGHTIDGINPSSTTMPMPGGRSTGQGQTEEIGTLDPFLYCFIKTDTIPIYMYIYR